MERNLQDAMQVVRNVIINPRLVPGGGAFEMALAQMVNEKAKVQATSDINIQCTCTLKAFIIMCIN